MGNARHVGRRMRPCAAPSDLAKFLRDRLPLLQSSPDAEWVADVAAIHSTTPEIVWLAVRAHMPTAPPAPLPVIWTRQTDVDVPGDQTLAQLRAEHSRPRG